MWDFDLMAATRTLEKSMPFAVYRFVLYLGVGLGYLLATLAGAGTLIGFASLSQNANAMGPIGAMLGFAGFAFVMYKLRPFLLRHAKVPQLGLLAELAQGEALPSGAAQIDHAKRRAALAFPSTSALFRLDGLLRGSLAAMVKVPSATGWLAHPAVATFRDRGARLLFAGADQSILAWQFRPGAERAAVSAVTGLAIHYRHFAKLFRNRFFALVFQWAGFALAYPVLLAGIRILVEGVPIAVGFWPQIFAGVFAWVLKAAFLDPIAEAALLQVFLPLAETGADAESVRFLAETSEDFRAIQQESQ